MDRHSSGLLRLNYLLMDWHSSGLLRKLSSTSSFVKLTPLDFSVNLSSASIVVDWLTTFWWINILFYWWISTPLGFSGFIFFWWIGTPLGFSANWAPQVICQLMPLDFSVNWAPQVIGNLIPLDFSVNLAPQVIGKLTPLDFSVNWAPQVFWWIG